MIGRSNSPAVERSGVIGMRLAIVASLFGAILWAGPVGAQTAPMAPEAEQAAPPSAESTPVAPTKPDAATDAETSAQSGAGQEGPKLLPNASDTKVPSALLPRDLSPWGMFLSAVPPVKAVMVGLAFASLMTWTVWLAKTIELWNAKRLARRGLKILAQAASLRDAQKELTQTATPLARFVSAAAEELDRSTGLDSEGIKDRVATLLSRLEARADRAVTRGIGVLATIGATAPFVGLFGTVWGIMDSFIGISKSNTTNLAVVAPGIAEALLATALGLIAAIPAVVMYNAFARSISGYRGLLADAAAEVLRYLSRDLDRAASPRYKGDSAVTPLRQLAE